MSRQAKIGNVVSFNLTTLKPTHGVVVDKFNRKNCRGRTTYTVRVHGGLVEIDDEMIFDVW